MIKKTDQTKKGVELMIPGIVIGVIVLIIVIWLISSYNGFVTLRNKTEEAFSAIDVSLKKRYDLIPNYVETVKGYAKHESETLEKVVAARNQAMTATNIDDKIKQENVLSGALKSLFAVSESYPELKANELYANLSSNLICIEDEIANSRKSQVGSGDRSEKIRTYNYPQGRITDHRIGMSIYQMENFLNGDLDEMIDNLIAADRAEKLKGEED